MILKSVSKSYQVNKENSLLVLNNLSCDIVEEQITCIVGPSGCGKSTLLNIIAKLIPFDTGTIFYGNLESTTIGYILQNDLLLPWRSVYNNILLGIELLNFKLDEKHDLINGFLKEFKLSEYKEYYPSQLSGGMRKKVSLIRTFLCNPKLILFDEPFAHIDYRTRLDLEDFVVKEVKGKRKTAVFVTHNIEEAILIGDKIIMLSSKPSKVLKEINLSKTHDNIYPSTFRTTREYSQYLTDTLEFLKLSS